MHKFAVKPEIFYSDGAVSSLVRPGIKRVLVIIDPVMMKLGAGTEVERAFFGFGDVVFAYYANIEPDPGVDLLADGVRLALDFSPQLIVALGGGSAIDGAKVIAWLYCKIASSRGGDFKKPLFAAIPTTSGTGSEVTNISVITVGDVKTLLIDDSFFPDIAVIDAAFTRTLPLPVLADTAADALTHAFEALISKRGSDCSDAFAEKAIKLIFANLPKIFVEKDNSEARDRLHNASCIAGMAFTNASLGINHSMAHAFGSVFHVPHGRSNALFLTKTLRFNAQKPYVARKLANVSRELGFARFTERDGLCADKLLVKTARMLQVCGIPVAVSDLGIGWEDYVGQIPRLTQLALNDKCTADNAVGTTAEDFVRLYLLAYK